MCVLELRSGRPDELAGVWRRHDARADGIAAAQGEPGLADAVELAAAIHHARVASKTLWECTYQI